MAITQVGTVSSAGWPGTALTPGVVNRIEAAAYKMMYEEGLLAKLCKPVGQGSKGSAVIWPYFDPTTFATAASQLTEANDFNTTTQLTNASVIIVASELGIRSDITDTLKESMAIDLVAEIARQQGIGVAVKLEKHILGALNSGVSRVGSVCGTNSARPFTFAKYAVAKNLLDAAALTVPGRKHCVIPTYSWSYTTNDLVSSSSPSTIYNVNGQIGEGVVNKYYLTTLFGDIDVYSMGLAYIAASSSAYGYMFTTDGVGLWKPRDFRLEKERNASARADEIVSTCRAGAKVLVSGYCKRLKMYASTPS